MELTRFKQAGTTRESLNIWADCPQEKLNDNRTGLYFFEDFHGVVQASDDTSVFNMHFYGTVAEVSRLDAVATGAIELETGSTNNDNANIALEPEAQIVLNSGKKIWFETRIAADEIDVDQGIFVGMGEEPFQLIGGAGPLKDDVAALTDKDCVGFRLLTGDQDAFDAVVKKDSSETEVGAAPAQVVVAGTYYNFGFKFDGATTIEFYVDGDLHFLYKVTAATVGLATAMGPVVGIKQGGSSARSVLVDWVRWGYDFQ